MTYQQRLAELGLEPKAERVWVHTSAVTGFSQKVVEERLAMTAKHWSLWTPEEITLEEKL